MFEGVIVSGLVCVFFVRIRELFDIVPTTEHTSEHDTSAENTLSRCHVLPSLIKKSMTMKETKRIRINKVMVGWSDGKRVNLPPSIRREVGDYGNLMGQFHSNLEEGYEIDWGECDAALHGSRIREYQADQLWEHGHHLEALDRMLYAASSSLPDEGLYDDMQWFNPTENFCWHPNLKEFRRLMRRCRELCKREPRLWPILEESRMYQKYLKYLSDLGAWAHDSLE